MATANPAINLLPASDDTLQTSQPPRWARPSHSLKTPRMILRSSIPSDAEASTVIAHDPLNSPFGGLVGAKKTVEDRRQALVLRVKNAMLGENAFLVCILTEFEGLEDILSDPKVQQLKVHDGYLIGMSGFNEFALRNDLEGKEILATDIGALIHHQFVRRGIAMETLQAVIEYGCTELKCDIFEVGTDSINVPFRGLMKVMGLGAFEKPGKVMDTDVHGMIGSETVDFTFGTKDWEEAKLKLKASGKWYL